MKYGRIKAAFDGYKPPLPVKIFDDLAIPNLNGHGTPDAFINGGQSTMRSSAAELLAKILLRASECWHFWD